MKKVLSLVLALALSIGLLVLSLAVIMGTRWGINRLFAGKEA